MRTFVDIHGVVHEWTRLSLADAEKATGTASCQANHVSVAVPITDTRDASDAPVTCLTCIAGDFDWKELVEIGAEFIRDKLKEP